ncbi:MAG: TrkA C-terminal domain-containing protein [Candidatus Eremiobacterota bacterium]
MKELLLHNEMLRLFAVIGLGFLLGSLRIGRFSLGVAGVLFAGLGVGAAAPGQFELPRTVATLGLVLFVYCIGLASGPGVFEAFRSQRGVRLSTLTLLAVTSGALTTLGATWLLGLPKPVGAGLFCGGLTNTPAMAAQVELLERRGADASAPVVGYSVAYPFGVLGVFLGMSLLARRGLREEVEAFRRQSGGGPILARNYRVTRLKPNGNQLEAGWLQEQCGLVVSRRLHQGHLEAVEPDAVLALGDVVLAVGTEEMHARAPELLGDLSTEHLEAAPGLMYRRFFVSNRAIVGRPLGELAVEGTVTRVRRGDVDMTADPDLCLALGDVVRVVSPPEAMERIARFFGDSLEEAVHPDFLSVSLGMVLGVVLGSLPLPTGGTLGVAGGTLIAGLLLGRLGRSGRFVWAMSLEANLTLRHVGLVLFLACVGLTAGGEFVGAMRSEGWKLLLGGAAVTLASVAVLAVGGRLWLRENLVPLLGMMAGTHTQPAALAYAESLARSEGVGIGYASVFPVAMLGKILLATLLVSV